MAESMPQITSGKINLTAPRMRFDEDVSPRAGPVGDHQGPTWDVSPHAGPVGDDPDMTWDANTAPRPLRRLTDPLEMLNLRRFILEGAHRPQRRRF
jgi:hypothetical protein